MSGLSLRRLGRAADSPFPPTRLALERPNGLLAYGGGVEPERLLNAYRLGVFPWYTEDEPILWWTPSPRCVFEPGQVRVSRRTRQRYNTGVYRVAADSAFEDVIRACAGRRRGQRGTWITPALSRAFIELHDSGHAHSVEAWQGNTLVGGVYGLAIGGVFFGESMFSRAPDASKIALAALSNQLERWHFGLLDAQVTSPHLLNLGASEWPRHRFERVLADAIARPGRPGSWQYAFQAAERWGQSIGSDPRL